MSDLGNWITLYINCIVNWNILIIEVNMMLVGIFKNKAPSNIKLGFQ